MYLSEASARRLLETCARQRGACVVFADRLPSGVESRAEAEASLAALGLALGSWTINARMGPEASTHGHMGVAAAAGDARALVGAGARVSSARHMGVARSRRGHSP